MAAPPSTKPAMISAAVESELVEGAEVVEVGMASIQPIRIPRSQLPKERNDRKQLQPHTDAIAATIAAKAAQRNRPATWPDYIWFVSLCGTGGVGGVGLDVTYQVYDNLGGADDLQSG